MFCRVVAGRARRPVGLRSAAINFSPSLMALRYKSMLWNTMNVRVNEFNYVNAWRSGRRTHFSRISASVSMAMLTTSKDRFCLRAVSADYDVVPYAVSVECWRCLLTSSTTPNACSSVAVSTALLSRVSLTRSGRSSGSVMLRWLTSRLSTLKIFLTGVPTVVIKKGVAIGFHTTEQGIIAVKKTNDKIN